MKRIFLFLVLLTLTLSCNEKNGVLNTYFLGYEPPVITGVWVVGEDSPEKLYSIGIPDPASNGAGVTNGLTKIQFSLPIKSKIRFWMVKGKPDFSINYELFHSQVIMLPEFIFQKKVHMKLDITKYN